MKVRMNTTEGPIVLQLDTARAPKTTENFVTYVTDGHYNGTIFHRVIDGFMIQGGGFTPDMEEKPTRDSIQNEAENGLGNEAGTIAMARTPDPHSASSQFFINANDNDFLDFKSATPDGWGYCVFGAVVDGLDVVEKIAKVATTARSGHNDVPEEEVVIERASETTDT